MLNETRYPNICLKQLKLLANDSSSQSIWVCKLGKIITDWNQSSIVNNVSAESDCPQLRRNHNNNPAATTTIAELLSNIKENLLRADLTRCEQSSFSSFYHRL